MAEQTPKVASDGVKEEAVAEKKGEEKEIGNKVTEKLEKGTKPTENVESDFEIITKETTKESDLFTEKVEKQAENQVQTTDVETKKEEIMDIKSVVENIETDEKTSETKERKKSIVDIAVIKEVGVSDDTIIQSGKDLKESVSAMPGMTKSVSQEILKRSDVTELKQIAQDLAEEDGRDKKEEEEGSVIDISVVEEDTDKDEDTGTVDGIEAEILGDDEEVTIVPGEDEEVVELTLETRHMLPVLSAIVGLAAAIYALIFYTNV